MSGSKLEKTNIASTILENVVYTLDVVKVFRNINPDIELTSVGVFTLVSLTEGVCNSDVCEYFKIDKDKANKHIQILKLLDLVSISNVGNLYLTEKGYGIRKQLLKILG